MLFLFLASFIGVILKEVCALVHIPYTVMLLFIGLVIGVIAKVCPTPAPHPRRQARHTAPQWV